MTSGRLTPEQAWGDPPVPDLPPGFVEVFGCREAAEAAYRDSILGDRRACRHKVRALLAAGWTFELIRDHLEPWQWAWRRPPRRAGRPGRRFASTDQAYNRLIKEVPDAR